MEINGREINFKRTIWATLAVGALCPDKDLEKLDTVLRDNFVDGNMAAAQFICILSEGYERWAEYEASREGKEYEPNPITMDEIMNLEDFNTFQDLFIAAAGVWKADAQPSVETEPAKGKKKSKANKSS